MSDAATTTIDELLAPPSADRSFRRFPEQVGRALRLSWAAARGQLVAVTVLQLSTGLGAAGELLVAKRVLTIVLGGDGRLTVGKALPWLVALACLLIAVRLAGIVAAELSRLLSGKVEAHAICQVADAATAADLLDYERPAYHDQLRRAQLAATSRPIAMVQGLTGWLGALTTVVGVGAVLIVIEPLLVALLVVGAVPVWLTSRWASQAMYRWAIAQTENDRQRNYLFLLLSHRDHAAELRAFSLAGFFRRRLDDIYRARLTSLAALVRRRVLISALGGTFSAALTLATLVLLVWLVVHGHLALAAAGTAAGAVVLMGEQLHGLSSGSGSIYENTLYMQDFTTFMQRWGERRRPVEEQPALPAFGRLQAVDVRFTYPSRTEPALDGVSVEIDRGEVVALVGENGSGKTTLAKVLAGLYQPGGGHILWDGQDLATIDPDRVRQATAVIFQEYGQYWMSAADNISIGQVERAGDRAAVVEAARRARADGFIEQLPRGYDNVLGSEYFGGANLSLGQWQRIALARAYFRDAPFVILDEPTASLDPKAEAALFESIRTLYAGRSVLLISHRFASCRSADRIYVLEQGRVVESGSHDQLMARDGRYAEMFRLQAAAYALDPRAPA